VDGSVYATTVHSFTHGTDYTAVVSCDYLGRGDRLLLVDDFLANGSALRGLIDLVRQSRGRTLRRSSGN
jgi:xanthine phosphoribosyltransferase